MSAVADSLASPPQRSSSGSATAFDDVRRLFVAAGFDEPTSRARLGIPSLYNVKRIADGRKTLAGRAGGRERRARSAAHRWRDASCGAGGTAARRRSAPGARRARRADAGARRPDVAHRVGHALSDAGALARVRSARRCASPMSRTIPQDYVFGALSDLTQRFLEAVPDAPAAVCSSCAREPASPRCGRRVAGRPRRGRRDIAPRAVHFARFNAQLNDLADRVHVVASDAWEALGRRDVRSRRGAPAVRAGAIPPLRLPRRWRRRRAGCTAHRRKDSARTCGPAAGS